MRDPWKALAGLLALLWVGVFLLRGAGEAGPGEARGEPAVVDAGVAAAPADPRTLDGDELLQREAAVGSSTGADGKVSLLLRAITPDGEVVNASVEIRLADGTAAETVRAGRYALLPAVAPGPLRLRWSARGHYDLTEVLHLPAAPHEQLHEAMLEHSARIEVRFVTPDGERLLAALQRREGLLEPFRGIPSLYATEGELLPPLPPSYDDEYRSPHAIWDGVDMFANLDGPDGTLSLRSRPPLLLHAMLRHHVLTTQTLETTTELLDVVIDPEQILAVLGGVRVRLLDGTTGETVGKGSVSLEGPRATVGMRRGEDGWFAREYLPPGIYTLSARFGTTHFQREIEIIAGRMTDLGELRIGATHPFRCRVVGPDGSGIAKCSLLLREFGPQTRYLGWSAGVWTDESGLAEHTSLLEGEYQITVLPPEGSDLAPAARHWVHPGAPLEPIRLAAGRTALLVSDREPAIGMSVCILVNGAAATKSVACSQLPQRITLAPGTHEWLLLDASGAELRRGAFVIPADGPEPRIEVTLP
jgi:hypothetical protein